MPREMDRDDILRDLHESSGHVGITKLYNMVREYYYWPKLYYDCERIVKTCTPC